MNRIKELRVRNNLSQAQLGAVLGCAGQSVSRFEREDHQLDPALIGALCDHFGCTADYLLGRSESPLPVISDEDARLLESYHAAPDHVRAAIDTLLLPVAPVKKEVS